MESYHETQKSYWLSGLLFFFVLLVLVLLIMFPLRYGFDPVLTLLFSLVMIFDGFLAFAMSSFTVSVDTQLQFGFRFFFHRRVPFSEISDAREITLRFWDGIGIHFKIPKTSVHNTRLGKGVRVELKNGKAYEFSCDHPGQVLSLLRKKMKKDKTLLSENTKA